MAQVTLALGGAVTTPGRRRLPPLLQGGCLFRREFVFALSTGRWSGRWLLWHRPWCNRGWWCLPLLHRSLLRGSLRLCLALCLQLLLRSDLLLSRASLVPLRRCGALRLGLTLGLLLPCRHLLLLV